MSCIPHLLTNSNVRNHKKSKHLLILLSHHQHSIITNHCQPMTMNCIPASVRMHDPSLFSHLLERSSSTLAAIPRRQQPKVLMQRNAQITQKFSKTSPASTSSELEKSRPFFFAYPEPLEGWMMEQEMILVILFSQHFGVVISHTL